MPDDRLVPKPTAFVLFGATGDLAHRLVLPAFFRLAQAGLLQAAASGCDKRHPGRFRARR